MLFLIDYRAIGPDTYHPYHWNTTDNESRVLWFLPIWANIQWSNFLPADCPELLNLITMVIVSLISLLQEILLRIKATGQTDRGGLKRVREISGKENIFITTKANIFHTFEIIFKRKQSQEHNESVALTHSTGVIVFKSLNFLGRWIQTKKQKPGGLISGLWNRESSRSTEEIRMH